MDGYIPRWYACLKLVNHPSTNRAQRKAILLVCPTPLPLCQSANKEHHGIEDETNSLLYLSDREKVTETGRTKQAAGDEQIVNRESECEPDSTSDVPATLHNQHTYNKVNNNSTSLLKRCQHSLMYTKLHLRRNNTSVEQQFTKEKKLQSNNIKNKIKIKGMET